MSSGRPDHRPIESFRYALVAAAVSAAIVAVVLWGTFVASTPPSPGPCTALECGPTVAIGSPVAEGGPSNHSYVMSITPSSGLRWGETHFEITTSSGANLTPSSTWTIFILPADGSHEPVAGYTFETGAWLSGGQVLATSGQQIDLYLGSTDLRGQGDKFVMFVAWNGDSASTGEIITSLP